MSDGELEALCQTAGLDSIRDVSTPTDREAAEAAIFQRLANAIRYTFRQPGLSIQPETTADEVPGWDSLSHAVLIVHVEQAFGIEFASAETLELSDVGSLAAVVMKHLQPRLPPGRRRKLIVYGNCQAGALGVVLRNTPAITARYDIVEHDAWAQGSDLARNLAHFDEADALLLQDLRNWRDHPRRDSLPPRLRIVRFPFYYVAALWPFDAMVAGPDEPMQRLQHAAQQASKEFPFGFQDGALARLRQSVPNPAERLRRYRDLDFVDRPDIARLAQLDEARLLADDARFGSTIGRYIVENYRHIRLFHAIAHPTVALIGRLAAEVVGKLDLDTGPAGLGTYDDDYMGHYQVPLHPEVIRTLEIAWANASTRYEFHLRERLTFDEYYTRYIALLVGE